MNIYKTITKTSVTAFEIVVLLLSFNTMADDIEDEKKHAFSLFNLNGTYVMASTGVGGSVGPEALFGVLYFEGDGTFSGTLDNNTGSFFGQRIVTSYEVQGTYGITNKGQGTLHIMGIPGIDSAIFMVTQTKRHGKKINITDLSFVTHELSESGNTIKGKIVRRMHKGDIDSEAMTGDFGFVNSGHGGVAPGIALGNVNWDAGTGIVKGDFTISAVDPSGNRVLFDFFSGGPYTPNDQSDGTGTTFSETTGGSSHYVVTKVMKLHGKVAAKEIFFVPEFLDPIGNFSPAFMSRISKH